MLNSLISKTEFFDRQKACAQKAQEKGLAGLLVWSRGGGAFDQYANVDYLTNFYQHRCNLPDRLPHWSGRSHCVLFIPAKKEPTLLVTSPHYREDLVAINQIRFNADFISELKLIIQKMNWKTKKIGIIGGDIMPYVYSQQIQTAFPTIQFIPSDDILMDMRIYKSEIEIEIIRKSCQIGSEAINLIMSNIAAGKTESQIISPALEYIYAQGATINLIVTCSGEYSNQYYSISFPGYDSIRKLKKGDLFSVDLAIAYQGYLCDQCRTTVVGNSPTKEQRYLLDLTVEACEFFIHSIKPGLSAQSLCQKADHFLAEHGVRFSFESNLKTDIYSLYPPHWGHGLGLSWERPWLINDEDLVLQPNMTLSVEKSLYQPSEGTISFEQNCLVTPTGIEILTTSPREVM